MSNNPQAPDWWQASDGKWYPPQSTEEFSKLPPPPGQPAASSSTTLILLVVGIVLVLLGAAAAFVLLNQQVGPGGLCGSMINRYDGGGSGPCWDELKAQAITAAVVGGVVAVAGLAFLGFGIRIGTKSGR